MLQIEIPGNETVVLKHLVLDYNGTIACDGELKKSLLPKLDLLSKQLQIHVITADTHGSVHKALAKDFVTIHVISKENQDKQKQTYIKQLGASCCVAVGNGFNDALMLKESVLGIVLMQEEGCATKTLLASDLVFSSADDVMDSLLNPKRIIASLRNG
ncbi:HAD hydrolase family protein [Thiomicrorhabdus hydrogeniphila]